MTAYWIWQIVRDISYYNKVAMSINKLIIDLLWTNVNNLLNWL